MASLRAWAAVAALLAAPNLSSGAAAPLSWTECVARALRENPELAAARLAERARQAEYAASLNGFLPSLSLSHGYGDSSSAGPNRWKAAASLGLDVFDAGRIAEARAAKADWALATAQARQASSELRFALRSAFLKLLAVQERVEVSRRVAEIRLKGAELVSLRYDSGRESKGNRLKAQAQRLQAEADLDQALRDLAVARRALARRLGEEATEGLSASGELAAPPPPPEPPSGGGLSKRPDLAVEQAKLRRAREGARAAASPRWPSFALGYDRSASGRGAWPSGPPAWSFGATLSYPLFGGGPLAVLEKTRAAERSARAAQESLRAASAEAALDAETSWSAYARAWAQARVQQALLEAARQRGEEADIRYVGGLLSYDNWEIIGSERVAQERQALETRFDAALAEADFQRALGKGLGEE